MNLKLISTLVPILTIKLIGSSLFFLYNCSLRWTQYEGKCYYLSTLQKTWEESQKECVQLNSHLVIITNKAELAFLNSRTQNADYFIGLRQRNSNGQWKWIDDTQFDPGLFNIQDQTSDCATIGLNSTVSRSCSELKHFVCEERVLCIGLAICEMLNHCEWLIRAES